MKLSEDQIKVLKEKLESMSPEEVEELKKQQGQQGMQQCPFCLIAEGKIESKVVYEDDKVMAVLDINPANPGHTILFPKLHFTNNKDLSEEDQDHIFKVANKLASSIVETVNAKGFNLHLADGEAAGQKVPHFMLHIIPRFDEDKINFVWQPKKFSDEEMDKLANRIKEKVATVKPKTSTKKTRIKYKEETRIP